MLRGRGSEDSPVYITIRVQGEKWRLGEPYVFETEFAAVSIFLVHRAIVEHIVDVIPRMVNPKVL